MTDLILQWVPHYGLSLIFAVVLLACLAAPLPASVLVLAAGSFAASGDLILWQVLLVTFAGFVTGDQIAFGIASRLGPPLLDRLRRKPRIAPLVERSETLLRARGPVAVLLSHTVISPTCAYISYLSGAGGMAWPIFSTIAVLGAAIWTTAYVALGFTFATQLTQVAGIISDFFGIVLAGAVVFGCIILLRSRWRRAMQAAAGREN